MIETATGIAFLMSSLYGAGHADAQIAPVPTNNDKNPAVVETVTDSKAIEAFVREEYADTPILIEVARCESTFRQFDQDGQVIRGKVNDQDVGVMQINEKYHADEAAKKGYDIYSVEGNVAFARKLYEKYGTSPWSSSKACWSENGLARK